jgi:plasmid replication initiation protein
VSEATKEENLLLPDRHPQHDLFVCDVADAVLKGDMASMEHPFYSLSKKPDTAVRRYNHGDRWIEVVPSVKGLATIYDKDILIYCISQMIGKMKNGHPPSRRVRIVSKELLVFINRTTGGKDYEALRDALDRLDGTRIRTNVETGSVEQYKGFGLIDSFEIKHSQKTGRILELEVVLSEWVFNAIQAQEVLTLHRDYFRLRKPIERRVYEIARKHCGRQDRWKVSLELLRKKSGSRMTAKGFRHAVKLMAGGDHLPDYAVSLTETDCVEFTNRGTMLAKSEEPEEFPQLDPETFHDARTVAPGYDVYFLEREWREWWVDSGKPPLTDPARAFIGFCKRRYEKNPNP